MIHFSTYCSKCLNVYKVLLRTKDQSKSFFLHLFTLKMCSLSFPVLLTLKRQQTPTEEEKQVNIINLPHHRCVNFLVTFRHSSRWFLINRNLNEWLQSCCSAESESSNHLNPALFLSPFLSAYFAVCPLSPVVCTAL